MSFLWYNSAERFDGLNEDNGDVNRGDSTQCDSASH